MKFTKDIKKLPLLSFLVIIITALLIVLIVVVIPQHSAAQSIGETIGSAEGKAVGLAVGSYNGIIEGVDAGKAAGLSAEDTTVNIANRMNAVGNLEVLVAGVKLKNVHSIGDRYEALYLLKGNAIFTINMEDASIDGIVFSPPYSFAIDYLKNDAFHLNYLGVDSETLKNSMICL